MLSRAAIPSINTLIQCVASKAIGESDARVLHFDPHRAK